MRMTADNISFISFANYTTIFVHVIKRNGKHSTHRSGYNSLMNSGDDSHAYKKWSLIIDWDGKIGAIYKAFGMVIVLAGGVPQRKTEQEELLLWKMSRFIEYNLRWFMKQILNDANIKLLHFFLRNIRCFRSKLREKRIWKIWNMNIYDLVEC